MNAPRLRGLVLAGGRSRRMAADKALIDYGNGAQLDRAVTLLQSLGIPACVSVRADQIDEPVRARHPLVIDIAADAGPSAGILAALSHDPQAAWLVLACDLPFLEVGTLTTLVAGRDPSRVATAFRSAHDGLPEPLCAIFEPAAREPLTEGVRTGRTCPRAFLRRSEVALLDLPRVEALDNVNTPDERRAAAAALETPRKQRLRVQYFALLREQAGRAEETVESGAATPRELLVELRQRHPFTLPENVLKVAINGDFAPWEQPLRADDAVVFIPPVAGG